MDGSLCSAKYDMLSLTMQNTFNNKNKHRSRTMAT